MKEILTDIIAHKRVEVAAQKAVISPSRLREEVLALQEREAAEGVKRHGMRAALEASPTGIIAEFKRRSPSKGWIHEGADVVKVTSAYQQAGASALSILTDEPFFGGSLQDLRVARHTVDIPLLRKEFIIDEYQLLQARIAGADAVLLIAACLGIEQCKELAAQAHALSLEVLLEMHAPHELDYLPKEGVEMLGVNNRNLGTFVTDVQNSFRMAELLRELTRTRYKQCEGAAPLLVSESGLSRPETLTALREAGFRGFLMGEAFMKHEQPGEALAQFIARIPQPGKP
ncbi:MAG: indole-3-glycerol phosphate synthase TrpC [Prevotellaceae bacterium]|nr:indole-3-glycerol phosphate synthase TrpC [Prevotellaceae bacterium]